MDMLDAERQGVISVPFFLQQIEAMADPKVVNEALNTIRDKLRSIAYLRDEEVGGFALSCLKYAPVLNECVFLIIWCKYYLFLVCLFFFALSRSNIFSAMHLELRFKDDFFPL
jgi:hypothetical protein